MSRMDMVEELGALVELGIVRMSEAVPRLVDAWQGGVTEYGAMTLLRDWQTVRADLERACDQARRALDEFGGGA